MNQLKYKIVISSLLLFSLGFLQNCANVTDENINSTDNISTQKNINSLPVINENNESFANSEKEIQEYKPIKINGIEITNEFVFSYLESQENKEKLTNLIKKSLKKDKTAFIELTEFNCGGGAGCYYLGSVIVQIIYRIGEQNAVEIFKDLDSDKACLLECRIGAGLEYGDNDYDDKMDNKLIEKEFPKLHKLFTEKKPCN
jgi:hypothetical protein